MPTYAVVLVRHGKLVFEQYVGIRRSWGSRGPIRFDATTKHEMRSVSRESPRCGGHRDRPQADRHVDEPVAQVLPGILGAEVLRAEEQSPLRHRWRCIRESSGTRSAPETRSAKRNSSWSEADPIRLRAGKASPRTRYDWNYQCAAARIARHIIERVWASHSPNCAREVLFEPLRISEWEWKKYENGKVSRRRLRLASRDDAKLGRLCDRGAWEAGRCPGGWLAQ